MGKDVRKDLTTRDLGRALGRKIARLERHVREIEVASQAAFRSVEEGAIDWYDDDGVLRERIGKQADGSYGRKTFTGDIPPAPTEPDVQVISDGVVAITWDGRWEERYSHVGWRNVQIHLGDTETFTPDRDTQVGAIFAPRGGTVVAVTESDDDNPVWVRLVGMNDAGQTGDPSVAVLVDELDEDELDEESEAEELEFRQDGPWDIATTGAQTFTLSAEPEQDSEHLYINGVEYDESDGWFRDGVTINVPSGLMVAGDVVKVEYAMIDGPPPPPPVEPPPPVDPAHPYGEPGSVVADRVETDAASNTIRWDVTAPIADMVGDWDVQVLWKYDTDPAGTIRVAGTVSNWTEATNGSTLSTATTTWYNDAANPVLLGVQFVSMTAWPYGFSTDGMARLPQDGTPGYRGTTHEDLGIYYFGTKIAEDPASTVDEPHGAVTEV